MSKIDELDKLTKAIADCDIRLKSIRSAVEQIDKEISVLAPRKLELEQNIEFLKKSDIIPIAHEYKKSKAELTKVRTRLTSITSDQKRAVEACKQIEDIISKFKNDHMELLRTSEDNVLKVLFGANRGKS